MAGAPVSPESAPLLNFSTAARRHPRRWRHERARQARARRADAFLADSRVATFAGHRLRLRPHRADGLRVGLQGRQSPDGPHATRTGRSSCPSASRSRRSSSRGSPYSNPRCLGVTIPTGGAYADIEVSLPNGGDLTTIRALESRAAPLRRASALSAGHGLRDPARGRQRRSSGVRSSRRPRRTTSSIRRGIGEPSRSRTPEAARRAGASSASRRPFPSRTGDMIEFDRGDASAMLVKPRDSDAKLYLDQPLESVPAWRDMSATYPFPGVPVRPQPPALTIGAGVDTGAGPSNTVPPSISGLVAVGETLTVTSGTWTGDAPITYSRVWRRDGATIPGATGTAYETVAADVGKIITVVVTAANSTASATAASAPAGPITGEERGGPDFFTVRPAGPYYVDPDNVPANTTRIEYEMRIRLGGAGSSTVTLAAQESTGCDSRSAFPSGLWRCVVEDGDGTKMISGASSFSAIPALGRWFKARLRRELRDESTRASSSMTWWWTRSRSSTRRTPPASRISRDSASSRQQSGGSPVAGGGIGTVDVEYVQAMLTTERNADSAQTHRRDQRQFRCRGNGATTHDRRRWHGLKRLVRRWPSPASRAAASARSVPRSAVSSGFPTAVPPSGAARSVSVG